MGNASKQAATSGDVVRDGIAHIYEFQRENKERYVGMQFWLLDRPADATTDTTHLDQDEETWNEIERTHPDDRVLGVDQSQANMEAATKRAYREADGFARRNGLQSYYYTDDLSDTQGRRTVAKTITDDELGHPDPKSDPEGWMTDVRARYAAGTLPKWKIERVEKIAGWTW